MPWEIKVWLVWGVFIIITQHYFMQLAPRVGNPGQCNRDWCGWQVLDNPGWIQGSGAAAWPGWEEQGQGKAAQGGQSRRVCTVYIKDVIFICMSVWGRGPAAHSVLSTAISPTSAAHKTHLCPLLASSAFSYLALLSFPVVSVAQE